MGIKLVTVTVGRIVDGLTVDGLLVDGVMVGPVGFIVGDFVGHQ